MALKLMIVAGEVSGDMHAAAILREMRLQSHRLIEAYGIGGDALAAEGCELLAHTDDTGVMGFWEVAKRARFFTKLLRRMTELLAERRPDVLLTVDYPGFNMRLAARAHAMGIRTVQYICPQVWAWHRERIPKIAAIFDRVITIFPFEPPLFDGTGLDISFTGHPLVDRVAETRAEPAPELPWRAGRRVALFPGSRVTEVQRILPDILAAAILVEKRVGTCSFVIPTPSDKIERTVRDLLRRSPCPSSVEITREGSRHVLMQAEAAVVKSGTGTLEASLLSCPAVIVYRVSRLSYPIIKRLVTGINHVGLVNIVGQREICPELLQNDLTPETLADELVKLLDDSAARAAMLEGMHAVNALLGEPGSPARTARLVLDHA